MSGIAQGIEKQVNVVKQSGLGSLGSSGSQTIRRVTGIGKAERDSYKSQEIKTSRQSSGASYGLKKVDYKLDGELSPLTYSVFIEAMLQAGYASGGTITGTDIAATTSGFTSASNGFLTAGFKLFDIVQASGFSGAAASVANSRNFWITSLTAGVMNGVFLDGTAKVADAAGESVTIEVVGKKCMPPLTGHTKDYLTIEDWYSDLTDSDVFGDMVPTNIDIDLPASGNGAISCSLVGLSRTASGTQVLTSPDPETDTGIMSAINGMLSVNGTAVKITGLKIAIANGAQATGAEVGSNTSGDVSRGEIEVSGSFTAKLRDQVVTALYEAETEIAIGAVLSVDRTPTSDFMGFSMGKVRMFGDAPSDGPLDIMRTYTFIARLNTAGGDALSLDKTILTIQDSAVS